MHVTSPVTGKDLARRRVGKAYVLLHAAVSICTCLIGLEYLIGSRWIPAAAYIAVKLVAMVGSIPFVLSSPVVFSMMIFVLSRRDREWLYLGICDASLLALQIIGTLAAIV